MRHVYNDGGRSSAGFKGSTGDCGTRAIAIATGMDYRAAYDLVNSYGARERTGRRKKSKSNARSGVFSATMRKIMADLGWAWTPTMRIGSGCTVHLADGELPMGRLIVLVSKHFTAVIDGVIHDTFDPQRHTIEVGRKNGVDYRREYERCVYGYWSRG
jgi:hypothetical protein